MQAKILAVLPGWTTVGTTGTVTGGRLFSVTETDPPAVTAADPLATSAAAPLVPAGHGILVIEGGVTAAVGVSAVAVTFSVTDCAGGVDTVLSTPGAVTRTDTGTDGTVIGPTVADTVASAKAVPERARQQPIAATTTGMERGTRMFLTSKKGAIEVLRARR